MKFFLFLAFVLLLFGVLIWNAGRQAFLTVRAFFPGCKATSFAIVYSATVSALLLLFFLSHSVLPRPLVTVTWYAMGFFVYFLMIFNLLAVVSIAERLLPRLTHLRSVAGSVAFLLLITVFLYGSIHAGKVKLKNYSVSLGKDAPSMKAVLISDLHLGSTLGEKRLTKIRDTVLREKPDVLLIAGDIFDGDFDAVQNPERLKEIFREMEPPMGTFACLGNHDAGSSLPQMLSFLKEANVTLLNDEAVTLENQVVIAGRRDSSPIGATNEKRKPLTLPEGDGPVILLDHQPGNLAEYGSEIDLVLCGHTHKGQMFPFGFITDALFEVDYGYYQRSPDSPQVIVSSGVGFWGPPLRVASDCEIVSIEINPQ